MVVGVGRVHLVDPSAGDGARPGARIQSGPSNAAKGADVKGLVSVWISVPECCLDVSARVWCGRYVTFSVGFELPRYSFTEGDISEFSCRRYIIPSAVISRPRYPTVLSVHPIFLESPVREHSHAGCLVALGPVLRRRRTYDGCFERCAPAVPQHDRPRASTIPLPAHSPCTAASEQSPAAIDPCGDVSGRRVTTPSRTDSPICPSALRP